MAAMKRIWAAILAFAVLSGLLTGCGRVRPSEDNKVIAVVAKGDETAFWRAVLIGAEDAALENGYYITFRGTQDMGQESIREQQEILQIAMDNEVVGVVVASVGEGLVQQLEALQERKIPVVQFDSGIWPSDYAAIKEDKKNPVIASVYTKDQQAACLNAEHLFDNVWWKIAGVKDPYNDPFIVGVIQHDLSPSGCARTAAFQKRFEELAEMNPETRGKYRFDIQVRSSAARSNYVHALRHLQEDGADAVFMTSGDVVDQVAEEIIKNRSPYEHMIFTGFDAGDRQMDWMRSDLKPILIGSVTQDAYALGYHAVLQCINGLEARGVTAFVEIPGIWYNRYNLEQMMEIGLIEEG